MDIHGYDMLNLEGPRQNFGGKTAMVTMAKNFSSKRGMQYLEHPPHHHLAPWELQTHWFLQDICCNLPNMKAIPYCASLHLTGSYLGPATYFMGALSIHIYPYLSTTTAGNTLKVVSCMANGCRADATETTPRLYLVGRNVQKGKLFTTFCSTRHVFLIRATLLSSALQISYLPLSFQ